MLTKDQIIKAIYSLADAKDKSAVNNILNEIQFKKVDAENLENVIQNAIASLLDILRDINESEKAAEISSFDNNIINVDEGDLSIPEDEKDLPVQVPMPPGTIDPNELGIPDNARKIYWTDAFGNIKERLGEVKDIVTPQNMLNPVDDGDQTPYINESVYPIQNGDWVSWDSSLGRSYGRVLDIRMNGQVEVPDSPNLAMIASGEDPVCIIRIFRNDKGQGWTPSDTEVAIKMSALHKISELEPPSDIPPTIPNSQQNSLENIVAQKGLNLKVSDGKLRGALPATFKSIGDFTPDAGRMEKINKGALVNMAPENVICCSLQAADTEIDRGFEKFSKQALDTFVKMYPGKPILRDHDWSSKSIIGKVFDASSQGGKLLLEGYFPKTSSNQEVVDNVLNGIYCKLSVGFAASPDDMMCSACGKSMFDMNCKHQPGEITKSGDVIHLIYKDIDDVFEVSIVAVPMQPDAHIRRDSLSMKSLTGEAAEILPVFNKDTDQFIGYLDVKSLPSDTIINDIDTIKDSLNMSDTPITKATDNLAGLAPVGTEGSVNPTTVMALMPEVAVDPPGAGTLDNPVTTDKAVADGGSLADQMDNHMKFMGDIMQAHENLHEKCNKMMDSLSDLHTKMDNLSGFVKPSEGALETKGIDEEVLKSFEKALADVNAKLDVAMTVSTEGIKRLLLEENVQSPAEPEKKKKIWVTDVFGRKIDDLGGQQ